MVEFNARYGTIGTALDTCLVCHTIPNPVVGNGPRNLYGTHLFVFNYNFAVVEPFDSDIDGFTNIAEIIARTFPGDPNSKPGPDTTPPVVNSFVIPADHNTLVVPILSFTANDNTGVTGWMVTDIPAFPAAADPNWSPTPPATFSFTTPGIKTLFAWAKDATGNVSSPGLSASVTITLTRFQDVPANHPSFSRIEAIAAAGITRGCQSDDPATLQNEALFCPGNPVTREQAAAFMIRTLNGADPVGVCAQPPFSDVPVDDIFCIHIEQMATRGITRGIGENLFEPSLPVTREQMAAFLIRAVFPGDPPGVCAVPPFPDVLVGNPFCRHIEELVARAITLGCLGDDPGTPGNEAQFCPADLVTRDQMAVFLGRAFLALP
ncbi:MAG: hypothetical protein A2V86_00180 [Deltaproteobacteria bacterium RBG_16_49_23]|nr:MAG: hypothetical protein A2V86_00180 [Deltaproteobacteria bacterium RBG_16_49_23]